MQNSENQLVNPEGVSSSCSSPMSASGSPQRLLHNKHKLFIDTSNSNIDLRQEIELNSVLRGPAYIHGNSPIRKELRNVKSPALTIPYSFVFYERSHRRGAVADVERMIHEEITASLFGGNLSDYQAVTQMTKYILTAEIFAIPYVFSRVGMVIAVIMTLAVALVMNWTMDILIKVGIRAKKDSYPALMTHCFGNYGYLFYHFVTLVYGFGSMVAYTVIIGESFPPLIESFIGNESEIAKIFIDRRLIMASTILFTQFPLSILRSVHRISKLSGFLILCLFAVALMIIAWGIVNNTSNYFGIATAFKPEGIYNTFALLSFGFVYFD